MAKETVQGVKGQPSATGFQIHPELINKAGGPDKLHWWSQLYVDALELESAKRAGYKRKESVVLANIEKAESGDMAAIKEIGDRVAGRAILPIQADVHVSQLSDEELNRRISVAISSLGEEGAGGTIGRETTQKEGESD